jgi:hypothetical protein
VIDITAAIESVVTAAVSLSAEPSSPDRASALVATAVALGVPDARRPEALARFVDQLRADPSAVAQTYGTTLGAALVWRAVDRAERSGDPVLSAAETGLRAALIYIDLVGGPVRADCAAGDPGRCASLAILDLQARLALRPTGPRCQPR